MEAEAAAKAATALVLRDGVIMLGAAMLFVTLFRRFGLGAVLGYLVAGAVVGPHALGLVGSAEEMLHVADFGIVLLLFLVGLELHPNRLWRLKHDIFGLGFLQVAVSGVALTVLVHYAADISWAASVAIGLPLALSSTAQVLPSLRSSGEINTPSGERAFSILLFQDLSIVPLITITAALSRAPADPVAPPGWQLGLYTIGALSASSRRALPHHPAVPRGRPRQRARVVRGRGPLHRPRQCGRDGALHLSTAWALSSRA
jgi:Kef-type K+ transport system membrane component KefB